ncbi:hypothetical protein ACRAVF_27215 [Bradyrhizobium oligotrophicum S58]
MAKKKRSMPANAISPDREDWEASDAMHTLMRAEEIKKDEGLMKRVAKKAREHAEKSAEVARRASMLAKRGLISDKQMSSMSTKTKGNQGGKPADLKKTAPIA